MKVQVLDISLELTFPPKDQWGNDNNAHFDSEEMSIRIVQGLTDGMFLNSLIHELIHVKQYMFGKDLSEDEANQDAIFWFSLLKNNLQLFNYAKISKVYTAPAVRS